MKLTLTLLLFLLTGITASAQLFVSGKVTDEQSNPIPFATVHIQNTTIGTSANSEGEYNLQLKAGQYTIVYKAVGYKPVTREVDFRASQTININLTTEIYELQDVNITGSGEDPAYAIIRKAIKKRKGYLNEVKAYTCEVYIKGLQKLLGAPKSFLGRDINQIGREIGLDSNRKGIIYLSESEFKYSYLHPGQVHEEMISSKVSGQNRAFSYNRASDLKVDFYENFQNWEGLSNRPLISPVAENALFYYNYKLLGATEENGQTINKIQIIPKRGYDPCFEGIIYILEDSWRLYELNLLITKKANINFVDTVKISQQFFPVEKTWMPSAVNFEFTGGLLGFKFGGYYISIYKNYDLNPSFKKKDFAEVLRITAGVNKKDSLYWEKERPIPLTEEEENDYIKKDKIAQRRESKEYMDSVDRVRNKVSAGGFLLNGISIRNRYTKQTYRFDALLGSLLYNTVEGVAINYGASYTKQFDTVNNRYFRLGAKVRYGFSNHLLNGSINATVPVKGFTLSTNVGSDVVDLNRTEPITPFINSVYSLLRRQNFQKLYQKQFANIHLNGRISGGWRASATLEWANRKWLPNTAFNSIFHPAGKEFTSNNPFIPTADVPLFNENKALTLTLRTSYDFSNKYETYPAGKRYLASKYPTIGFTYTKGIKNALGSTVDYDLVSVDVSKNNIKLGMYGRTSFYIAAGKFVNANNLSFPDYKQFAGNQTLFYQAGVSRFLLLDYYLYSTNKQYLEAHVEQNFSGFILNKVPLIRQLKLQEIVNVNYLTTPDLKNYTELGIGVQYLNFRIVYGQSFNSGSNNNSALRLRLGL
ncbi:DUF5686 and carboxypeptidase regulatory-like domain-containing protein [Mucilaginibacter puniceus]